MLEKKWGRGRRLDGRRDRWGEMVEDWRGEEMGEEKIGGEMRRWEGRREINHVWQVTWVKLNGGLVCLDKEIFFTKQKSIFW